MVVALAWGTICLSSRTAHADEAPKPAPRTAIAIGEASVVLVTSNDRLYAFVDRIEDNAPVIDAELGVDCGEGKALPLVKAADGLFVAPFNRAGHMQDAFKVTLRSTAGSGEATASIAYDDLPDADAGGAGTTLGTKFAIALAGAGFGGVASVLMMLWIRGRRQVAVRSGGWAQPV